MDRGSERGKIALLAHVAREGSISAAARAMGMWGEGPIVNAQEIAPALKRAIEVVKSGKPALVDVVTQHR